MYAELSLQEQRAGLLSRPDIGTKSKWEALLDKEGYIIVDHCLYKKV